MNLNPFKRTADTAPIYGRIQRKQEILERIKSIALELSNVSRQRNHAEYQLREAKNAIAGYSDERLEKYPHDRARKAEQESAAASMKDEMEKLTQQQQALTEERQRLEEVDLPQCLQETGIAEVLAHQDRMKALRADAKRLEEAIAAQRQAISEAEACILQVQDRSARRAELLADIAIGEAKQADLDKLDNQTQKERQAHEESRAKATPIISQATQTIAGLEAKQADLSRKIAWLERDNPLVLEQYLMCEIGRASALYVTQALALKESFLKLAALEHLLNSATGGKARQIIAFKLALPIPKLNECMPLAMKDRPDMHFISDSADGQSVRGAWINAERQRLAGDGLEIL